MAWGFVVECADARGKPRWLKPKPLLWDYSRFGQSGASTMSCRFGVALPPMRPVPAADASCPQVVQHQQRADAVDVRRALTSESLQLPVDPPCVFFLDRRRAQHRPHAPLSDVVSLPSVESQSKR